MAHAVQIWPPYRHGLSIPTQRPGIVVGVDGSPASMVAVDCAARDAAMRNVSLTLVHVASGLAGTWPQMPTSNGLGTWQRRRGGQIFDHAVRIADHATQGTGSVEIKTEMYYSSTIPTLIDMAKDAEMIVVGSRGHSALGSLLGSVSAGLVQHAHRAVAVIHDEDPLMPHPAQAPVLVGIDGSPTSELATAIAFDEASRRHVGLIALHARSDARLAAFPAWIGPRWSRRSTRCWLNSWRGGRKATPT